ncbi:TsoY family (seleno)protein [Lysinibacillus sp. NPDC097231]|uniref:TsoY family (seleno)protein n=1 Tax=Lysinibacillus sp. NPDC097231 TaxID=3364142 RepID=UPI00382D7BDF
MIKNLKDKYSPLYFLASLGAGGMGVSFFMYLMFLIPHPDFGMPTFEHIYPYIVGDNLFVAGLVILVLLIIVYFIFKHFRLLLWNISEFYKFKETNSYVQLRNSNAEVTLMAIPLTLGMSINGLFILGIVFVPNLRSVIEYLFPFAILAFLAVGLLALKIFVGYFSRFIIKGDFDFIKNNNLSQLIAIFAFAMIAVGLAAPAALSENIYTSSIAMFLSIFFGIVAVTLIMIKTIFGLFSMFQNGIAKETAPSLWIMIPILTLLGITFVRLFNGVSHNFFSTKANPFIIFLVLAAFLSLQIVFGVVGYSVMKKIGYFKDYVYGNEKSAASFTLICPFVAFTVLGMFFIGWGLVQTGIVEKYSIAHFLIMIPFIISQLKGIELMFRLNNKMFKRAKVEQGVPQYSTEK